MAGITSISSRIIHVVPGAIRADKDTNRTAACGRTVTVRWYEVGPATEVCLACRKAVGWPMVVTGPARGGPSPPTSARRTDVDVQYGTYHWHTTPAHPPEETEMSNVLASPVPVEIDADGTIRNKNWEAALDVAVAHLDWHQNRIAGWRMPPFGEWYANRRRNLAPSNPRTKAHRG